MCENDIKTDIFLENTMPIIQITNTYSDKVLDIVKSCTPDGFFVRTIKSNSQEELINCISDADYILASGRVKISRDVLDKAQNLKMIQRTGVGLDSLDIMAIKDKKIPLYVNSGVNSQSVAEHTLLLILACLRRLTLINANSKNGVWNSKEQAIDTYELYRKTVGIIGLGSIGGKVASILKSFSVKTLYYSDVKLSCEMEKELGVEFVDLDQIFQQSDIITLHCPLTPNTKCMINDKTLSQMKNGVIIVNTGRGGLIDEDALYKAIQTGKVDFAGLDVHAEEPFGPDDQLLALDRVIATPHIAGVTFDSFYNMIANAMRNIELFETGEYEAIEQYRLI